MKIVAALTDPARAAEARQRGADLVELRVDLFEGDVAGQAERAREACALPIIVTLRSAEEGGRFFGGPDAWMEKLRPLLPFADYIDVEERFACHAPALREAGKTVIASYHTGGMVPLCSLFARERDLRAYGDIPKIVVTPRNLADLTELVTFTEAAAKPVITGVMGSQFRFARAILPFFGSEFAYCHAGDPTAAGQYSVEEFARLRDLLGA